MSSLPLEGLLVVALEQAVAAPYCSSRLADAGARVIKIERDEGDFTRDYDHVAHGESAYFVWLNRGKESLTLNIKQAADKALIERAQTGKGQRIQVSLFDCIADWMTVPLLHQDYANQAPQRLGLNHPTIAPYGVYSSGAGNRVVLSIQNHREWAHFCEFVLIRADLTEHKLFASNVLRCQNRASLDTEINSVFSQLSHAELLARLKKGNIAYGCLNSVADLSSHSQLRRTTVDAPSGPVELVASSVISSNGSPEFGPVPAIGEHNTAIGKEFSDES